MPEHSIVIAKPIAADAAPCFSAAALFEQKLVCTGPCQMGSSKGLKPHYPAKLAQIRTNRTALCPSTSGCLSVLNATSGIVFASLNENAK